MPEGDPVVAPDERAAMAVLVSVQHLGPMTLARLVARFGTAVATLDAALLPDGPAALIGASRGADGAAGAMSPDLAAAVVEAADRRLEIAGRIASLGLRVLLPGDTDYPCRLRSIELPPSVLFARGPPNGGTPRPRAGTGRSAGDLGSRRRDRRGRPRGCPGGRRTDSRLHRR